MAADVFLYSGEASPSDIRLRDPTVSAASIVTGTLAATEDQDTSAFVGAAAFTGTLSAAETQDSGAFTGSGAFVAVLAATEVQDSAALAGVGAFAGALAATEAQDTADLAGTGAFTGSLSATEGADVLDAAGLMAAAGVLTGTDVADTAIFGGAGAFEGTLVAAEATDSLTIDGLLLFIGEFAANEGYQDEASFDAVLAAVGSLGATEASDTAQFVGGSLVGGTLTATDAPDVLAMAGTSSAEVSQPGGGGPVFYPPFLFEKPVSVGTLNAVEAQDTAVFTGTVVTVSNAQLRAVEEPDIAKAAGVAISSGLVLAFESQDTVKMVGEATDWTEQNEELLLLAA